ncbi:hydrogenase maturation protease [Desulforhopalus vacuolatus]|uniref:hydrogenase maturation protease n=1 Tax=Desulforhopalus vacuolatus TaxID=40414 RepID=UPI001964976C|nr:hydrogenase maturation protease [Desulforhopalus vacuolatus]MBM9520354.1 hydrogenase maturation protease [Desulforhopalus vacuolatus]
MKKIGVIGVGNPQMGDDGIGPVLIHRLNAFPLFSDTVCFIDGGTGGMTLVHELAKLYTAIIVDAGDFGGKPGEFRIFSPEELVSVKQFSGFSVHEWDLIKTIEISKVMEELPEHLHIMAIQPETIAWQSKLSKILESQIPVYEKAVWKLLKSATE